MLNLKSNERSNAWLLTRSPPCEWSTTPRLWEHWGPGQRGTDLRPSRVHCPIYKNISNIPSLSFPRLLQGQIKAAQLQPDVAFCSSKCERKSRAATDSEGTRHHVFWTAFYYKDACYDATKVVLIKFGFSITYVFNFERRSFQSRR